MKQNFRYSMEIKERESGHSVIENKIGFELRLQGRKDYERQYKIGSYFADFYFPENNLVLEIDGLAYHSSPEQIKHDRTRDKYMNDNGFCVIRVSGSLASKNPLGVLTVIKYAKGAKTYFLSTEEKLKELMIAILNSNESLLVTTK